MNTADATRLALQRATIFDEIADSSSCVKAADVARMAAAMLRELARSVQTPPAEQPVGRCPNCDREWADCDAYLRDEGVAHGQDLAGYCQRGARLRVVALAKQRDDWCICGHLREHHDEVNGCMQVDPTNTLGWCCSCLDFTPEEAPHVG